MHPTAAELPGITKRSFVAIEGFRGLAAMAVATLHAAVFFGPYIPPHSYLAVDFFFILSGIVLAHSYDGRLASGRLNGWSFFGLRALRLYPIIILSTVFAVVVHGLILAAHSAATPFHDYASLLTAGLLTALLVPQVWLREFYPLNGPLWSLFFELIVNLLFGFGFSAFRGRRLVVGIGLSALAMILLTPMSLSFDQGFHAQFWALALARTAYGFFVGVLIARLPHGVAIKSNGLFYLGAALLCAVFWAPSPTSFPFDTVAALILLPPIAWLAVKTEPQGALARAARFLGKASYPLYAFNLPAVLFAAALVKLSGIGTMVPGWVLGIAFLASTVGAAYAIDRIIDEPIRSMLKRRFFTRSGTVPRPAAPAEHEP